MGIKYTTDTSYRTVTEKEVFIREGIAELFSSLAGHYNILLGKVVDSIIHEELSSELPAGNYKINFIFAEIINYNATSQRYENIMTMDVYLISTNSEGEATEGLFKTVTRSIGRTENSIL